MRKQKEIRWLLREKYRGKPTNDFYKDIKRLKAGEPLDYVIGFTEFGVPPGSCKIDLSKKPLIPRSETEFWVQKTIQNILTNWSLSGRCNGGVVRVLDIFAGSGCIGLSVLKNVYCATVVFADNDKKYLEQIKINLKINTKINTSLIRANKGCTKIKRSAVVKSDVFENINGKFDFIFANPPYIPVKNKNKIQKSVLNYEPLKALFGGADGLFYIKKFLSQAQNYLKHEGRIFMEFSPEQKKDIEKIIKKYEYSSYEFHKDQYNKWRWVSIG